MACAVLGEVQLRCSFTSTETIRTVGDGEPRTATSTCTQLLRSHRRGSFSDVFYNTGAVIKILIGLGLASGWCTDARASSAVQHVHASTSGNEVWMGEGVGGGGGGGKQLRRGWRCRHLGSLSLPSVCGRLHRSRIHASRGAVGCFSGHVGSQTKVAVQDDVQGYLSTSDIEACSLGDVPFIQSVDK